VRPAPCVPVPSAHLNEEGTSSTHLDKEGSSSTHLNEELREQRDDLRASGCGDAAGAQEGHESVVPAVRVKREEGH
jgi:hypothetical protein